MNDQACGGPLHRAGWRFPPADAISGSNPTSDTEQLRPERVFARFMGFYRILQCFIGGTWRYERVHSSLARVIRSVTHGHGVRSRTCLRGVRARWRGRGVRLIRLQVGAATRVDGQRPSQCCARRSVLDRPVARALAADLRVCKRAAGAGIQTCHTQLTER